LGAPHPRGGSDSGRFAFLVMQEHPYGCEMLEQLLSRGLSPDLIVEEESGVAAEERSKFLDRIAGHRLAPSIASQAARAGVEIATVPAHTDEHCLELLEASSPRLLVLGGTRILRDRMLSSPPDGVLNSHPGLLPECRGSASPAWSVYHDIPVGSSCHLCTPGIDEGDLVGRREVPVRRGDRYEDICYRTLVMAGTLMGEALEAWTNGRLEEIRSPQGESPHPTFRNMPDELLAVVHRKLREETYRHYVGSS